MYSVIDITTEKQLNNESIFETKKDVLNKFICR